MTAVEAILAGRPVVISEVVRLGKYWAKPAITLPPMTSTVCGGFRKPCSIGSIVFQRLTAARRPRFGSKFLRCSQGLGFVLGRAISQTRVARWRVGSSRATVS